MTDDEVGDRLLEMREATARRCVEIAQAYSEYDPPLSSPGVCFEIRDAIKKEFRLEE